MGSLVYSEVVHDTPHHPFTSSMLETASSHTRRLSNDLSYRPVPQRSNSQHQQQQQQRPSSSTPRASSNVRGTPTPSSSSSQQRPRNASTPSQDMSTDTRDQPSGSSRPASPEPSSPKLGPADDPKPSEVPQEPLRDSEPSSNDSSDQSAQPGSLPTPPNRVKVKDLQHIADSVNGQTGGLSFSRSSSSDASESTDSTDDPDDTQYEISSMPISDVIEMVAGLLTKITTTNDRQHEHLHRQIPPLDGGGPLPSQTSSVLSFHGKNVPSISIMSYLSRIHKYCPTTYDVFLSLLVYFDRMTERVNAGPLQNLRRSRERLADKPKTLEHTRVPSRDVGARPGSTPRQASSGTSTPPSSSHATPEQKFTEGKAGSSSQELPSPPLSDSDPYSLTNFFVVDSFNIHRLIIAGVTCASKFFSDIFYTNSRYAKVGGLPLAELNHLEIQFLILNDFRLSVPAEELEAYGTMLVKFYAREVHANKQHEAMQDVTSP